MELHPAPVQTAAAPGRADIARQGATPAPGGGRFLHELGAALRRPAAAVRVPEERPPTVEEGSSREKIPESGAVPADPEKTERKDTQADERSSSPDEQKNNRPPGELDSTSEASPSDRAQRSKNADAECSPELAADTGTESKGESEGDVEAPLRPARVREATGADAQPAESPTEGARAVNILDDEVSAGAKHATVADAQATSADDTKGGRGGTTGATPAGADRPDVNEAVSSRGETTTTDKPRPPSLADGQVPAEKVAPNDESNRSVPVHAEGAGQAKAPEAGPRAPSTTDEAPETVREAVQRPESIALGESAAQNSADAETSQDASERSPQEAASTHRATSAEDRNSLYAAHETPQNPPRPEGGDSATRRATGQEETVATEPGELPAESRAAGAARRRTGDSSLTASDSASADPAAARAVQGWSRYSVQAGEQFLDRLHNATQNALQSVRSEVVRQVRYLQGQGRSEMRVQLHPPDMGRIRVEVEMREGRMEVRMRVENPDVRDAVTRQIQSLDRSLRDVQVEVSRFEVTDYEAGRGGAWSRQDNSGMPPGRSNYDANPAAESREEVAGAWTRIYESGAVDCLV